LNVRRDRSGASRAGTAPDLGEVYIEHQRIGNLVKVSAIHAATAIEVSIQGPATALQNELETLAVNKLKYVMAKKNR
jgi:Domain of unknown function (DUF6898)